MKPKYLLLLLLLPYLGYSQQHKKRSIKHKKTINNIYGRISNISFSARLKYYPFNKIAQIQLVSFDGQDGQRNSPIKIKDGMPNLPLEICIKPFTEIKTLTLGQIDELSDILYNYGYIKRPVIIDFAKCYEPKNGILFLDQNGVVIELMEICFGCSKLIKSSEKIMLSEIDNYKIALLKEFFCRIGIHYGTSMKADATN